MKKSFKKVIVAVLAAVMVFSMLPCFALAQFSDVVASGVCCDELTWEFYSDGTLLISGSGNLEDYNDTNNKPPWDTYTADIKYIVIGEGINCIGKYAFYNCDNLIKIVIPKSMERISEKSFPIVMLNLEEVHISDLESWLKMDMEDNPMYSPDSNHDLYLNGRPLTSVVIPESVTEIKSQSFAFCKSLKNIQLHDKITEIGNSAFMFCESLESINLPESIAYIGAEAFEYCFSLDNVVVPANIDTIEHHTFAFCRSLKDIVLPDQLEYISSYAFYECSALENINIPDSVISISKFAFGYCKSLKTFTLPENVSFLAAYVLMGCDSLENLVTHKDFNKIGEYALSECKSLENIPYIENVKVIGEGAFAGCSSIKELELNKDVVLSDVAVFKECSSLEKLIIPGGAECGDHMFRGCSSLKNIPIADNITSIGRAAFYGCDSLKSIDIPQTVEYIDLYAFSEISSGCEIHFKGNVPEIADNAFAYSKITAFYPCDNHTWAEGKLSDYHGETEWKKDHGDNVIIVPGTLATYKIEGTSASSYCSLCGDTIMEQEILPRKIIPAIDDVNALSNGYNSVRIVWDNIDDVSGYTVYRSTSKDGKYTGIQVISGSSKTTYIDKGLKTGRVYYYKIRPFVLINGKRVYGMFSSADPAKPLLQVPENVNALASGKTSVKIMWDKVSGASGYTIYRSTSKNGTYKAIKRTSGTNRTYTDKGLKTNKAYYYKVRAYNVVNGKRVYGAYSSVDAAKPKA